MGFFQVTDVTKLISQFTIIKRLFFLNFTKEKRNLMNKWNIMENSVAYKQLLH